MATNLDGEVKINDFSLIIQRSEVTAGLHGAVHRHTGDEHTPCRDCKGVHRSAIAAVTPDGGSIGWLQRNPSRLQERSSIRTAHWKAWSEGVLGIAGGEGRVSWPRLKGIWRRSEEGRASWSGWRGEPEPLRSVGFSAQDQDSSSVLRRSGFSWLCGQRALS